MALVFCFFERLGDKYFSCWYVQHMLPYGTGISLYAFIYIVFLICDCFYSFFFFYLKKSDIETPDRKGQWYQHLLTFFVIFYESNTQGTNFRMICLYVLRVYNVHSLYCIPCSPEMTHRGLQDLKQQVIIIDSH